jgi:hypothetical protein
LTSIRALVAVLAIATPVPAVLAGCGGGGDGGGTEDPQQVLDQTFDNPTQVNSGNLGISLSGSAEGQQGGDLNATITGPFQKDTHDPTAFPQFNLTAKISASGSGQSLNFDGSLIATKDNAYVEYQGQPYEVGTTVFKQFAQAYQQSAQQAQSQGGGQSAGSLLERFGVDPKTWLTNLSNEGDEDVEGTDTIHIHGDADISKIVSDFGKIAQQVPGGTAQQISPQQLDQLKSAIKEATVDVYSGKDDHVLRKLALALTIAPPASAGAPVSSINVDFSITISDINQPQTISAPSGAKPIADLLSQLGIGGLGPLGSIGGASGGTGGVGGGGGPSQAYLQCVQQAAGDPNKINACASKLQ